MNYNETAYNAAVRNAMRYIRDCCYGRPCLNDCLRRLGASLPPCACVGGWRPPRWAKLLALAAALAVFLFAVLQAQAEVTCVWTGSSYSCSGVGSSVQVIGGSGEPVTVTNFWGVCTNCVQMSPSQCSSLKDDLDSGLLFVYNYLSYEIPALIVALRDDIIAIQDDIATFRNFGTLPDLPVSQNITAFSNYVYTVDNTQTSLVRDRVNGNTSVTHWRYLGSYSNGIYDYAQSISPFLSRQRNNVESVDLGPAVIRVIRLRENLESNLNCEECQAEYEPGNGPDSGGGGLVTNVVANGNWCTFDQGEAIKSLLADLKTWAERQYSQLSAISNYVQASYETLRSGLYSDYTAIPRGEDWQTLYLQGQPTGWGYDPTNILQRIEVLIYGLSGISTNVDERLEDTTPDAESTVNDIKDSVAAVATDADGTAATTLGNAVLDFFRAFTPRTKNYQGGEEIIAEVSINVGDDTHYVPAMRLGESGFLLDTMTTVKTCVNGFCSVIFCVGGAFAIFRFWAWFSAWCVKLSKWAVELCTSLFAS